MRKIETATKPGTSGGEQTQEPRVEAEGLAGELLRASKAKAHVVESVMNDKCGPGTTGIADDFGAAVEIALKARLVYRECGPWNNSAGYQAMEEQIKKKLGHDADAILRELPPDDVEAVRKLYDDCVEKHRETHLPPGCVLNHTEVCGPDVAWPGFDDFIEWVGRAMDERYRSGAPALLLPVGGIVGADSRGAEVEIPSFADRLIDWVGEPMGKLWSGRTLRETINTNLNIDAARAAEPRPQHRGKTIKIPVEAGDADSFKRAAKATGQAVNEWARGVLLDAARQAGDPVD